MIGVAVAAKGMLSREAACHSPRLTVARSSADARADEKSPKILDFEAILRLLGLSGYKNGLSPLATRVPSSIKFSADECSRSPASQLACPPR